MKQNKGITGFDFQFIPVEEARAIALIGSGNYADLKAKILEVIPTLTDKAFAFGLPKGEVPEDQRRGICIALNSTLRKAGHPWRATYSGNKKLFIVYPKSNIQKPPNPKHGQLTQTGTTALQDLITRASVLWNIEPAILLKRNPPALAWSMRKAIQHIAVNNLRTKRKIVQKVFGLKSPSSVLFNLRHINAKDQIRIKELLANMPGGKIGV